jgi:hypothetical protein
MSEPDSTSRRRPPTIDLTAKEVEAELGARESAAAGAASNGEATGDSSRARNLRSSRGAAAYAIGAVVGAVAVAAIVAAIWISGFAQVRQTAAAPSVPAAKTADADEISSRLDKIQQALQAPSPNEPLAARLAAAQAQMNSLGDQLTALTRRVDDIAAASQAAAAEAKAAAATADAAKNSMQTAVPRHDIDALNNRIAALESEIRSLSTNLAQRSSSADDRAARATVAAEALRSAVERGAPYQTELAAVKSFGADQSAVASLAPFAGEGVPSASALGRELSALMPTLAHAPGAAPSESSFLGRLESHARKLIHVTPIEASANPVGDESSSVIAHINDDAARGDITAALADISRLPEAARSRLVDWVKKAEAREAAIAASRRIAADALAALGAPAAQ